MPKLSKQKYYGSNGEAKINSYVVNIPKAVVKKAFENDEVTVKIYAKDNKIIIEKE